MHLSTFSQNRIILVFKSLQIWWVKKGISSYVYFSCYRRRKISSCICISLFYLIFYVLPVYIICHVAFVIALYGLRLLTFIIDIAGILFQFLICLVRRLTYLETLHLFIGKNTLFLYSLSVLSLELTQDNIKKIPWNFNVNQFTENNAII